MAIGQCCTLIFLWKPNRAIENCSFFVGLLNFLYQAIWSISFFIGKTYKKRFSWSIYFLYLILQGPGMKLQPVLELCRSLSIAFSNVSSFLNVFVQIINKVIILHSVACRQINWKMLYFCINMCEIFFYSIFNYKIIY